MHAINLSNAVFEFTGEYDTRYVGKMSHRLVDRMIQHMP